MNYIYQISKIMPLL